MLIMVSQAMSAVFNQAEVEILKQNFFANFRPLGAIVASPSQQNPNYYYDWVRDSAIAMSLVETWYESNHASDYKNRLYEYVNWTKTIQHQIDPLPNQDILGEPKFYLNGYPFDGAWGRPQNDGPAIRASVLIRFAHQLLDQHETNYVTTHLYRGVMDPSTMGAIKMDLEYIAHHWQDDNFDLWEEVYGHHFFTAMSQKKALLDGATLANRLYDTQAALYYTTQAKLIDNRLQQHLDKDNHLIRATLPPHSGPQKTLELDTSVLLGVLLNPETKGNFAPNSNFVINTVKALHHQFASMFPLNQNHKGAVLFGRYPGDTYDGYHTDSTGNPWYILTATVAEYYYTLAANLPITDSNRLLINKYLSTGDEYLNLVKQYAPDLNISEQINLNTGLPQGAVSLTWSYVSVLRAIDLREKLVYRLAQSNINTL
ncbi:MAG TPA: glycoside hydrolase family 15 protein [Legionella sp.]|nr:glycoside hydrolase family 15 protein [Legionella sp.]